MAADITPDVDDDGDVEADAAAAAAAAARTADVVGRGDLNYDSLPDPGAEVAPEPPDPNYENLPDPGADAPMPWARDEAISLRVDTLREGSSDDPKVRLVHVPADGAPDSQRARVEEARKAVGEAYLQGGRGRIPENTPRQLEAGVQRSMDGLPSDTAAKEVEFEVRGPPNEVEFQDPTGGGPSAISPDWADGELPSIAVQTDRPMELHTPEEQRAVDAAKAELAAREREGEVLGGDPVARAEQWHEQGHNDRGYRQDCALAATAAVLRDCGVDASESDVVDQASSEGLCDTTQLNAAENGGVKDGRDIRELLTRNGVESAIENPQNAEELAVYVEEGQGVVTEIDADELWDAPPTPDSPGYYDADGRSHVNHAVQVTGTVRGISGELAGIVINDTGHPEGAGRVVPLEKWDACWSNTNNDHETVVTTRPTSVERASQ